MSVFHRFTIVDEAKHSDLATRAQSQDSPRSRVARFFDPKLLNSILGNTNRWKPKHSIKYLDYLNTNIKKYWTISAKMR